MSACRERTNPNNKCRARNYRAYHRDCFRQRQQQDRYESVVRMPPDKIDDPGKIRRHRFVFTRTTRLRSSRLDDQREGRRIVASHGHPKSDRHDLTAVAALLEADIRLMFAAAFAAAAVP